MRPCYFWEEPPKARIRKDHIIISPPHTDDFEVAVTPDVLEKTVAAYNRILDEWHERQGAKVVRLAIKGPRAVSG